jgi:hypothetical protein
MTTENENTNRFRRLFGRRGRIFTALLVAVVAAVGVGIWLGPASSADDSEQAAEAMDMAFFGEPGDDPGRGELREDVKELRALEGEDRREAMMQLRENARDGKYGDRIERRFERRADHRAALFALLPDEMQADLEEAKDIDDAEDRRSALRDIRKKALDGDYGEKVKEAFTILGEHRPGLGRPGHEPPA